MPRAQTGPPDALGGKLITLFGGGLAGKVLGAAREIAFAYVFGTTFVADAFRVALTALLVPTHFFTGDALFAAFIPAYRSASLAVRERLVRSVFSLLVALMLIVAVALFIGAPLLVSILAPGFDAPTQGLTSRMIRVGAAGVLLYAISAMLISVQVAEGDYLPHAVRPSVMNLAILAAIFAAAVFDAPLLLAVGFVVAYALMAAWTLSRARRGNVSLGRSLRLTCRPWGDHLQGFFRSLGHLSMFVLLTQANIVVDRVVATLTGVGGVASLDYAHFVTDSLRLLIAVPIATLVLGQLGGSSWEQARGSVEKGLSILLFGSVLVSLAMWTLAEEIVTLLYMRGAFQQTATELTTGALRGFALGAWAATTGYVYLRVFNATLRNREVAIAGAVSIVVNMALDLLLYGPLGVFGVALATSVSAVVFLVILVVRSKTAGTLITRTGVPLLLLLPLALWLTNWSRHGLQALFVAGGSVVLYGLAVAIVWPPLRRDLRWAAARFGFQTGPPFDTNGPGSA